MSVNWLKNAVIYQAVVDRFSTAGPRKDSRLASNTSDNWMGGNLKGVINHLDYLKELGVNTLYLSPLHRTSAYHGYSVVDFFSVDSHFGKEEDLKKLVKLCHQNHMRVILDFVPNHMSLQAPIFREAQQNEGSKYKDWFVFKEWPRRYLSFLDVEELPKINVDNKEAREYIVSVAKYWLEEFCIDGYRLDHAIGPSLDFWREFREEIKSLNNDFALIGEAGKALGAYLKETFKEELMETLWIFKPSSKQVRRRVRAVMDKKDLDSCLEFNDLAMKELEGVLDGCMDFSFRDLAWAFAEGKMGPEQFWEKLSEHYEKFRADYCLISLLSNHDCGRFLSLFGKKKTKFFSSVQFSLKEPTLVYYGEEIGMGGKGPFEGARRFMIWDEKDWDKELFGHYRSLCRLRRMGKNAA